MAAPKFYDSLDSKGKKSELVLLLRQRRAFESENIHGFTDTGARPRAKLPEQRPVTPPVDDSSEWSRRAKRLDKNGMTRVLQALQERLDREQTAREKVEAKLERSANLQRSGSLSFSTLPYNEKCKALQAAMAWNGAYPRDAAGTRPRSSTVLPKAKKPLKGDWGRPRSTVPLLGDP